MKQVEKFQTASGAVPFDNWFEALDQVTKERVLSYVRRVQIGGAKKNVKALGSGVFEIKISFGPGFRVYFGEVGKVMLLLLIGGDKGSQSRDIRQAKQYWSQYVSK